MTRAEERALKAYPDTYERYRKVGDPEGIQSGVSSFPNTHVLERKCYIEGYEQAEKDLALTWEDMQRIVEIYYTLHDSYKGNSNIYEEVLRRFNKVKEEKK